MRKRFGFVRHSTTDRRPEVSQWVVLEQQGGSTVKWVYVCMGARAFMLSRERYNRVDECIIMSAYISIKNFEDHQNIINPLTVVIVTVDSWDSWVSWSFPLIQSFILNIASAISDCHRSANYLNQQWTFEDFKKSQQFTIISSRKLKVRTIERFSSQRSIVKIYIYAMDVLLYTPWVFESMISFYLYIKNYLYTEYIRNIR